MIPITDAIVLTDDEVRLSFIRGAGPGGQHVNTSATAVQLRFDAVSSPSLPEQVRRRLLRLAGNRLTAEGELIITARRYRSQERNRQDAIDRLVSLIRQAATKPKARRATKPGRAARERRLKAKRRQADKKRSRGRVRRDDY